MLLNRIKNRDHFSILPLCLVILFLLLNQSVNASEKLNLLNGISYNTLQAEQIELVFSFSEKMNEPPAIETSTAPAFIKINFGQGNFNKQLRETVIKHAGVKDVFVETINDDLVAMISLDKLPILYSTQDPLQKLSKNSALQVSLLLMKLIQ